MSWKATGPPTVRKQRDRWVVRVDGLDTSTGKHRPRQTRHLRLGAIPHIEARPRSYERALERIVKNTGLPRLTSHGLPQGAATHMVSTVGDVGELRAIADILGHGPEILLNSYSHALPRSQNAVVARLGRRST
ncbi:MAG: hypothetical protein AAB131_00735 [Actinomycetota bacterium]